MPTLTTAFRFSSAVLAACALGSPPAVAAQAYPFSQRSTISQSVAHTNISVTYGRPVARGRALFGTLVPWDSVWHPGADSATVVTFSHDVLLDGRPLAAGAYSLWLIPRPQGRWVLIFNRAAHVFHQPYPGAASDALRLEVTPETGAHMESMAIYFPAVLRDEATFRVHWGSTFIAVQLKAPFRPT